jgi:hypothetical protein
MQSTANVPFEKRAQMIELLTLRAHEQDAKAVT